MDKILNYQKVLTDYLESWASQYTTGDTVEYQLVCDTIRQHYQLQKVGWRGDRYIHQTILHFDIRGDKVWVQENRTETEVGDELVKLGIPKDDIVLGLQPPELRKFTG
ncbi:MAG: XisI protein [Saprospiraceae bacterium]